MELRRDRSSEEKIKKLGSEGLAPMHDIEHNPESKTPRMTEFEAAELHFAYEGVAALRGLSLTVREGERIALLGANGSGKSTLLRMMDGLLYAGSGSLKFRGQELTEAALSDDKFAMGFHRQVGMVFQNPDVQLFNPTVFDEVAFGPLQMGWSRDEVLERVHKALEWIGASHLKDRAPYRLSGGEKKRVALASVVVLEPDVLLLDEPFAALDFQSKLLIENDTAALVRQSRRSLLLITHDIEEAVSLADRVIVLSKRPTRVKASYDIELGEERTDMMAMRLSPGFSHYVRRIWADLDVVLQ